MTIYKSLSAEWREARGKVITGTEVSSLFGLNPYKSVPSLVRSKLGDPDEVLDNPAMMQGRRLEPGVIIAVDEAGYNAEPAAPWGHVCFLINKCGLLGCSLDGVGTIKKEKIIVEAKTTRAANFDKWCETNMPPLYYIMQTHVEMLCADTKLGLLAAAPARIPFVELAIWGTVRNKKIDKLLVDTTKRFWDNLNSETKFVIDQKDKAEIRELLEKSIRRIL